MFVNLAEAAASAIPIADKINMLVVAMQAGAAGFIALKCISLGIEWKRGHEHGSDELSALGIKTALIAGATTIGTFIGGAASAPLLGPLPPMTLSSDLGDLLGNALYMLLVLTPGLCVAQWRRGRP